MELEGAGTDVLNQPLTCRQETVILTPGEAFEGSG